MLYNPNLGKKPLIHFMFHSFKLIKIWLHFLSFQNEDFRVFRHCFSNIGCSVDGCKDSHARRLRFDQGIWRTQFTPNQDTVFLMVFSIFLLVFVCSRKTIVSQPITQFSSLGRISNWITIQFCVIVKEKRSIILDAVAKCCKNNRRKKVWSDCICQDDPKWETEEKGKKRKGKRFLTSLQLPPDRP